MFHNDKIGNLYTNLGGYFELFFIMIRVGNLYINLEGYFELTFIMTEVSNLYAQLESYFKYFHNGRNNRCNDCYRR
jgi:hypothetical protein